MTDADNAASFRRPGVRRGCVKPAGAHPLEELWCNWKSRRGADDRIDLAIRAERGFFDCKPALDLIRREGAETIEAPTKIARQDLTAVANRMGVGAIDIRGTSHHPSL